MTPEYSGRQYLFRVSVEPEKGYGSWEKRKKPYYVVATDRDRAYTFVNERLDIKWKIKSVSRLAEQYSGNLFVGDIRE